MADRAVVAKLVLNIAGYTPAAVEASKSTSALKIAQKETAAAAKEAGLAQRDAGIAAKDAAATASASAQAQAAAQKEAAAAAKEAASTSVAASQATTDADRIQAEAVAQGAAERSAAAKEALAEATAQAKADAEVAASTKAGAAEAAKYATAQRDVAGAAKEAAAAESTAAKASKAAAAERTDAYKSSSTAMNTMALVSGAAVGLMVKDAGDYQSATQHFVTDAGESQKNLGMVQAGILKTAVDTGTGATALTDAMYHIESAGFHGADGLRELTVAAQGAKVGNADLGVVAKTLTGTMNSYNLGIGQSVPVMNQLIATVGAGDMKLNDLAGSLGNVTPKAAAAKISLAQVGGAIATMTSQNMSADQATQDLSNTISALQNPNNVAIQQMQQLGLNSTDVSQNLGKEGLTGTLQTLTTAVLAHTKNGQVFIDSLKSSQNAASDANTMLQQLPPSIQGISKELLNGSVTAAQYKKATSDLSAPQQHLAQQFEQLVKSSGSFNDLLAKNKPEAETFSAALSKMLGGTTGLNTALMLTGGRMPTFEANVAAVQAAADKGGTSVDNWDKIQGTFNQKIDVAKASLGALGIAIGTTLLPVVADMAKWITSVITPIAEWVNKNQTLTAVVLGSAAALAALILGINAAIKVGGLVKTAYDGVKTAIDFFGKSADAAAVKAEALGAAQAASAKQTDVAAAASTGAAVKAEALGVANAAAAEETNAAAVSTGSWAGKLGASIPIMGAVVLGAQALAGWVNKVADGSNKSATSVDQWTTSLLSGSAGAQALGLSADEAQKTMVDFGGKANASISPIAAVGVTLAKQGQMMGEGASVVRNYDAALASLVSGGHADGAAALMGEIASATDKQGVALINTQKDFPQYWAAVDKSAANQALAANATTGSTAALDANTTATDANSSASLAQAVATESATTSTDASTAAVSGAATQQLQAAAATWALAQAQAAGADASDTAASATKAHTAAKVDNTGATNAATAAAKAHTSASKADATTQKDQSKATADQSKADDASAKSSTAAANAAKVNADANSTAAEKKKANGTATSAAAAAARDQTKADNESARASGAASSAADKHTAANDKSAKASKAAADASSKQAAANSDAAKQAAADAEAAREATEVHKIGVTWLKAVADAEASATGSARDLDSSVGDEVGAMKAAQTAASNLKDGLDALNGVHISAGKAALDEQQKVADLTKALYDNGKSLDITTDKGRANMTAIYNMADAANAHAQAVAQESGSVEAGGKAMDASRAEFDAVLKSAGLSTTQIDAFNKALLNTPKLAPITIHVTADTSSANASLNALAAKYAGLVVGGGPSGKHIIAGYSTGGLVTGAGGPTSDSNMVAVSNEEYIVSAAAVARPGVLAALNSLNFGSGSTTVVKPQIPMTSIAASASSAASSASALNIENYFEAGANPQQVAAELGWLAKSRGGSW